MQPQFDVAAIHARRRIVGRRIDDFGDQFARCVLREHPPAEVQADAPHGSAKFIERQLIVERQAAHDRKAAAGADVFIRRIQFRRETAECELVFGQRFDGDVEASALAQFVHRIDDGLPVFGGEVNEVGVLIGERAARPSGGIVGSGGHTGTPCATTIGASGT